MYVQNLLVRNGKASVPETCLVRRSEPDVWVEEVLAESKVGNISRLAFLFSAALRACFVVLMEISDAESRRNEPDLIDSAVMSNGR